METLRRFCRYNAWANTKVFKICSGLDAAALSEAEAGSLSNLEETLKHLVGVENFYLHLASDTVPADIAAWREAFMQHPLNWYMERSAAIGEEYQELLAARDADFLEGELRVPWLPVPITVRDGLLQVLTHSGHHRAQVLSVLGARGLKVPDIDYIYMLAEAVAAPQ